MGEAGGNEIEAQCRLIACATQRALDQRNAGRGV
jgi:hypothetical protein